MSKNTIFLSMERGSPILLRILHKNPPLDAENDSQNSERCASQNREKKWKNLNMMFRPCEGVQAKKRREKSNNEMFRSLCEGLLAKSPSSRLGCSSGRHGVREVSFSLFSSFSYNSNKALDEASIYSFEFPDKNPRLVQLGKLATYGSGSCEAAFWTRSTRSLRKGNHLSLVTCHLSIVTNREGKKGNFQRKPIWAEPSCYP